LAQLARDLDSHRDLGSTVGEATLNIADSRAELRDFVPQELYDVIAAANQVPVEDLDI
jgi:EXLDI family protein